LMDEVTEQAGALAFHTKQAEAVLKSLREALPVPPAREPKGAKVA